MGCNSVHVSTKNTCDAYDMNIHFISKEKEFWFCQGWPVRPVRTDRHHKQQFIISKCITLAQIYLDKFKRFITQSSTHYNSQVHKRDKTRNYYNFRVQKWWPVRPVQQTGPAKIDTLWTEIFFSSPFLFFAKLKL